MWELGVRLLTELESYIVKNQTPVIVGGVFSTFAPHLVINQPLVNIACVGEGENALVDLCNRIRLGIPYIDVTNLWVKGKDGVVKKNSMFPATADLEYGVASPV